MRGIAGRTLADNGSRAIFPVAQRGNLVSSASRTIEASKGEKYGGPAPVRRSSSPHCKFGRHRFTDCEVTSRTHVPVADFGTFSAAEASTSRRPSLLAALPGSEAIACACPEARGVRRSNRRGHRHLNPVRGCEFLSRTARGESCSNPTPSRPAAQPPRQWPS